MANWLLDYIEMTEYIPSELREQLTSIRELDLQVHNAMDELERDIKHFFSKIHNLSPEERQEQYEEFLRKCDVASKAAGDKVIVADKLHDLVVKSMRLLDQGLEKLKEDLLEGDKAYIVEDLERKSQELDEQLKLEHENMIQQQQQQHLNQQKLKELKNFNPKSNPQSSKLNINNNQSNVNNSQIHHRLSLPSQSHNHNNNHHQNHQNTTNNHQRVRNNSIGGTTSASTTSSSSSTNPVGRQRKRERKRLNSTMSIFNRNSRIEDETAGQNYLNSPLKPDHLNSIQNSSFRSMIDVTSSNDSNLTLKGMMTGNIKTNTTSSGKNDKSNGNKSSAGSAKQPILTAIDAAHAVSPNATNSDKLILFSSNANGDKYNLTHNITNNDKQSHNHSIANSLNATSQHPYQQLSSHLLSTAGFSHQNLDASSLVNNSGVGKSGDRYHHDHHNHNQKGPFQSLPLSSRHDPIMMAASQAINATQNMTPGRRTSSLKASYAAVNSGRLQTAPPNQQMFDQQGGLVQEIYCMCRSHIQGSNMIACDNSKCKIEWFHYECVGITTPPEGEWYCDECRMSLNVNYKGNKQAKLEGVNVT